MPRTWWSPSQQAYFVKQPHGECYDVVFWDPSGLSDPEEHSTLPDDAMELDLV